METEVAAEGLDYELLGGDPRLSGALPPLPLRLSTKRRGSTGPRDWVQGIGTLSSEARVL